MQSIITLVVHANQYGFIKGRTIQYGLAWVFQLLHLCHQSKREIVILKLDFQKAFDMVEHEVILQMLQAKVEFLDQEYSKLWHISSALEWCTW
jgi:hypothetical protein